ncbi:MAG: acetylxylan esterase [Prevotella sp.]|nr:acetylxylan esterase [Prevotella sp.]
MRKILTLLLLIALLTPAQAQIRGNNIVVSVTPDHKDWNYAMGEKAHFVVNVRRSGTLLDNVDVDYEAGPVMYPEVTIKHVTLAEGTMNWTGTMKEPGFYRLKVTAHVDGKDYVGLCTAGFSPEKIEPATQCPADFDEFWGNALKDARQYALDPHKTLLPDRCTETVNVYEVSFVNNKPSSRIYGILCVPVKPGKYPALLRVPGAGVRPYSGDVYTASQGAITLEIGIHGFSVTLPLSVYVDMRDACMEGYWESNLDQPDKNFYKRVVVGAVRAVDYIASLPEWNGNEVGVSGASQGGFLSLAVAALDNRITFLAPVHDAMCDYEVALKKKACGWPHYFYQVDKPDMDKVKGARYYDGINFARRVKCPGWYSFGYNDEVVPPSSAYSVYNVVNAPKTLSIYQMTGHYWYQEQWDEWEEWLLQQMHLR